MSAESEPTRREAIRDVLLNCDDGDDEGVWADAIEEMLAKRDGSEAGIDWLANQASDELGRRSDEIDRLRAENEALRAALARFNVDPADGDEHLLDAEEMAVYRELRRMHCSGAVDPDDHEDCAYVAVQVVAALRQARPADPTEPQT